MPDTSQGEAFQGDAAWEGPDPLDEDFQLIDEGQPSAEATPAGTPQPTPATPAPQAAPEPATPAPAEGQQQPTAEQDQLIPEGDAPPAEAAQPDPNAPVDPNAAATAAGQGETKLFADKYSSIEDFEAGHKQLDAWATQVNMRNRELETRNQQLENGIRQATPLIQQMLQQQQQRGQQQVDPEALLENPAALQQYISQEAERIVQQRLATMQQPAQAQQQAQAAQPDPNQAVALATFRAKNPDHGQWEPQIHRIFQHYRFDPETGQMDDSEFPVNEETLEVALTLAKEPRVQGVIDKLNLYPDRDAVERAKEILANPNLMTVVLANPHVVENEDGMIWARQQAGMSNLPAAMTEAQTQAQQQTAQAQQQARQQGFVEPPSGAGAPAQAAPGTRARDEFDDVLAYDRSVRSSPIGL